MAKKIRRMRTFARTAAKSMEKKLVDNAKKIKKDPYLILPDYDDGYSSKFFGKIKKTLDKVNRFSDDTKKLEKLSNKRGLDGAVAGTILVAHSEKAPYLAVAKFPTGDITYAQRGRADKEKLIAVQHFDDPILRLLGIKDIVLKKRLHVYSWDNGYISTGLQPDPPEEFVTYLKKKTGFSFKNNVGFCSGLKPENIKNKESDKKNYLCIYWKSADLFFGIPEDSSEAKKNTFFNITKYMLAQNIADDFKIDIIGRVIKQKDIDEEDQMRDLEKYLSGNLKDNDFIKANIKHREQTLKDSGKKVFILDGITFGSDVESFIKTLKPNKYEKEGLNLILDQVEEPVIMNNVTPNKVLEYFWKDFGLNAINEIIDSEEMAEKFFSLSETPSDIFELVFKYKERQKILSQLPSYKSLPSLANFVDKVTKTYKTFGEKEALAEIKKRPDNPKGKSVSYAFLLVFGKGKDKKWQYSPVEIEYGEFLKDYVKQLLDSKPQKYHEALKNLLAASGSSEDIDKNIIK
jgi:hypothetical protein